MPICPLNFAKKVSQIFRFASFLSVAALRAFAYLAIVINGRAALPDVFRAALSNVYRAPADNTSD